MTSAHFSNNANERAYLVSLDSVIQDISKCAPPLELVALGKRFVLHNPRSGTILTTDCFGRELFSKLEASADAASLLAALADLDSHTTLEHAAQKAEFIYSVLSEWRSAGLFAANQLPFPDAVADDNRQARYSKRYQSDFGLVGVETDDHVLSVQLDAILRRYAASASETTSQPKRAHLMIRCVSCEGGGLGVFQRQRALWGRTTRDEARYLIVREAAQVLCGSDRVGAILHGAAVLGRAGALLIIGESGRGKSTLAQGLVDAGCGFLADDHLALHVDGREILAFPTGSAVKRGARQLKEVQDLRNRHGVYSSSRSGVDYLAIPPALPLGAEVPVRAIIVPQYDAQSAMEIERMDPEAAFVECIASGARPSRNFERIAPLARLCDEVPAYRLAYGRSSESISACLELLDP